MLLAALMLTAVLQTDVPDPNDQTPKLTDAQVCDAFVHNADGSWVAKHHVILNDPAGGPQVIVTTRSVFTTGITYSDIDVAEVVSQACEAVHKQG